MMLLMVAVVAPAVKASTDFNLDWSGSGVGDFTATWSGSGNVQAQFNAPGTNGNFGTGGTSVLGSWHLADTGAAYGMDYTTSDFGASFSGGGYINYNEQGLGGSAGTGFMVQSDDTGSVNQYIYTNYASLYVLANDNQFSATGNYQAGHGISSGPNGGQWSAQGSGSMTVTERVDSASYYGTTDWTLGGPGCGCYGTSLATLTGSGQFQLNAGSGNYLAGVIGTPYASATPGWTMPSGGNYNAQWNFNDGFVFSDFSLAGK